MKCEDYGLDKIFVGLYDNIVVYLGEVIKRGVNGHWEINKTHSGGAYPFISVGLKSVQYMPINAFKLAISSLDKIDFRKEVANEVRRNIRKEAIERKIEDNDDDVNEDGSVSI